MNVGQIKIFTRIVSQDQMEKGNLVMQNWDYKHEHVKFRNILYKLTK